MRSLAARALEDEQMDAADLDPAIYRRVVTELAQVNRVTLASWPTLAFVRRALGGARRFRLLEVGFGDGAMLRTIARWADQRGLAAELVGIDLNPKSAAVARDATPAGLAIDYRTGDYAALAGGGFDLIFSGLTVHHMTRPQQLAFLRFMEAEAARGWLIHDLRRSRFAYLAYPLLTALMRWHRIIREDGQLSIARSYRPEEWPPLLAEAGVADARVYRAFPFKLCVERLR